SRQLKRTSEWLDTALLRACDAPRRSQSDQRAECGFAWQHLTAIPNSALRVDRPAHLGADLHSDQGPSLRTEILGTLVSCIRRHIGRAPGVEASDVEYQDAARIRL